MSEDLLKEYISKQFTIYRHKVVNFFRKYFGNEGEDLAQEAFMKVYSSLVRQGKTIPLEHFKAYLYEVCRSVTTDAWRKRYQRRIQLISWDEEIDNISKPEDSSIDFSNQLNLRQCIYSCMERLPLEQKRIFILREIDGQSYKDIAVQLGIPENRARQTFLRAKKNLLDCLERKLSS